MADGPGEGRRAWLAALAACGCVALLSPASAARAHGEANAAAARLHDDMAGNGEAAEDEPALHLRRGAETRALSLRELSDLPQHTIVTENDFSDGAVAYTGPLVRDVIALLDLTDYDTLLFTAANEYSITIPTSDFAEYDAVLATKANGMPLSLRDKGPIWLMYPLSDNPDLSEAIYIHRLVWQLVRIEAQ